MRLFDGERQVVLDNVFFSFFFFFRGDACCFGDKKPTRVQFCASRQDLHSVKYVLRFCKRREKASCVRVIHF